jgi:hypothetical protein
MHKIEKLGFTILPNLIYSPGFATFFFSKIEGRPLGTLCDSNEGVERTYRTSLEQENVQFCCDGFEEVVHCWRKCVVKQIEIINDSFAGINSVFHLLIYPY